MTDKSLMRKFQIYSYSIFPLFSWRGKYYQCSQKSIYEGKSSPNTSPGLNYSSKELFFTLGHWKAYDEVILMTSWACHTILSFRRDEICRQSQFEGSPGVTKVYCWHKHIWWNWALIHLVRTAVLDCRLSAVQSFTEKCITYPGMSSKWFLGTTWDTALLLRMPHLQAITEQGSKGK